MPCLQHSSLPSSFLRWTFRSFATQVPQQQSPVILRPYQHECIDTCLEALASGSSRIGVSLPTGSGKTTVFLSLLSRIPPPVSNPNAVRSLVVVNSIELARQSAEQASHLFPHWSVEIEQGIKHSASGLADLTVATYQTLIRAERVKKFDPNMLKAIIIDEAHHAAAPSYRKLLSQFDANILHPDRTVTPPVLPHSIPIIGFSATFSRHDGLALGSVFERIVYHRDFLDMIREQWLCDIRFTTVKANLNLNDVDLNPQTGDFNPTSLAQHVNTDAFNELVVKSWIDRASERQSTLAFCVNIDHVRALTATFRKFGVDARYVDSQTNNVERKELISQFRAREFPVLVNCAILTEGADIPNIDCVVLARPTRSPNIYSQMIGRGMRLSPKTNKTDCRILDFVDVSTNLLNVVSLPTLFGLDPSEITDEENVQSLEAKSQTKATDTLVGRHNLGEYVDDIEHLSDERFANANVTYIDQDDPFAFVDNASGARNVFKLSRNAWVGCGDGIYVLPCLQFGEIRIQPKQGENDEQIYTAYFIPQFDKSTSKAFKLPLYMRKRHVLDANTLAEAIKGCDTYASKKVLKGSMALGLLRTAKWRAGPATDPQKKFIANRLLNKANKKDRKGMSEEQIQHMTKGEAANLITRLKHGAQARYEKKIKEISRVNAVILNEQARLAKYKVQVGPLTN